MKKMEKLKVKKVITKKKKTKSKKSKPGGGGGDGIKWRTLEHNGVLLPPPYTPHGIKMLYKGKPVKLSREQEEIATMFAAMIESDYVTKATFLHNFWHDWRSILGKNHVIQKLEHCDFSPIYYEWHTAEKARKKTLTTEQKRRIKAQKLAEEEHYMWAIVDGVKERVGNFRVEPPGIFRGRGDHPKMGKLKPRIQPRDIIINIGKGARVPGRGWREVRHDNTVSWLACWSDPISKDWKYVWLAASSNMKGQSDLQKYEKARKLKDYIDDIRATYTKDLKSTDITTQQIAVATYLIDRLALRAGNEKDEDEADTVGCCSLKVEHVTLVPPSSLRFDFLGKDSVRYFNTVPVKKRVYKAIRKFQKGKHPEEDLFENLDTTKLNLHLKGFMPGLTAKVFRTYNASVTLEDQLQSTSGETVNEMIGEYQRANKEVAILCNHHRSESKSHSAQMMKLQAKVTELEDLLEELEDEKPSEAVQKKIASTKQKIQKMRLAMSMKDDLKTVALGTSKINYMDPRITVAWCKRNEVPIEKIFNKSLLSKFSWAMNVKPSFRF